MAPARADNGSAAAARRRRRTALFCGLRSKMKKTETAKRFDVNFYFITYDENFAN